VRLFQKGQVNEAVEQFRKALEIKPTDAEARNGLGVALAQKGKLNETISQFQEVLRVRPDFSPAQNNLARARALLQQDDGGE
jgi:Flp pilus assembly protein TadD